MPRRTRIVITTSASLIALALAGFAGWWFLLRSDAPPPVDLEGAVAAATSTTTTPVAAPTPTPEPPPTSAVSAVDGTWTIATGSFAGYRVEEQLATIGLTTAAGRSEGVTGSLTVTDGAVTTVMVTVDMTALRSDSSRRDQAIESQALETRRFPTATFELTEPVPLPTTATAGDPFTISAFGDLTIHGVTRPVTIDLEAQFVSGLIVVVGSTHIAFSDYDISSPQAPILLSVDDEGIMEFSLVFAPG